MTKITITSQKKNTTMPGMAYPATDLVLATGVSYPAKADLFGGQRQVRATGGSERGGAARTPTGAAKRGFPVSRRAG